MNKIGEIIIKDKGYSPRIESLFGNTKIEIVGIHKNGKYKMETVFNGTVEDLLFNLWTDKIFNGFK